MMETVLLTINTRGRKKPIFIRNPNRILTNDEERTWLDFAPSFFYESEHQLHPDYVPCKEIMGCMIRSIDESFLTSEQESKVNEWKRKINRVNDGVEQLFEETDPCVISCLMWTWLRLLKVNFPFGVIFELNHCNKKKFIVLVSYHSCSTVSFIYRERGYSFSRRQKFNVDSGLS